jgi:Phosphotransferase enzyme family
VRVVSLVAMNSSGTIIGMFPPFEVETPWWMDMTPVVRGAHERFGERVTVLRLLSTERAAPHGGAVTYLVELDERLGSSQALVLDPWIGTLSDDPMRVSYAKVGGPASDLQWTEAALNSQGLRIEGWPEQHRTWNLSSIWKINTLAGAAWLKVVPSFFAHEGLMIEAIASVLHGHESLAGTVPPVIGHEGPRILMSDIAGGDRSDAQLSERMQMIDTLVGLQRQLQRGDTIATLLAKRVPDWRGPALTDALTHLIEHRVTLVNHEDYEILGAFVQNLPGRFHDIEQCGLHESVVHGDFHAGNVVGNGQSLTIIDWGDSGIGHPLLDQPAFLSSSPPDDVAALQKHWSDAWRQAVPGCQPERAGQLLAPIAAARQALIYQNFLDAIEVDEQCYHRADPAKWLHRTADILRK